MKLLVIGSDRNLFKKNSDIWDRYLDYGKLFEEIHIIVFSHKKLGNQNTKIGDNVFIYPTNHICKLLYLWSVYRVAGWVFVNSKLKIINCRDNFVVSCQDPFESGLAGWLVKKIYKIPLQIQIHTDFLSSYFWQESLINKFRVFLAKFILPRADGIRVVSERIRRSLVTCHLSRVTKIEVLPIFVDSSVIKSVPITIDLHKKYSQFDFIILMASRLTKEKNIPMAIEAMTELTKKYPKLGLVIVGSGPELQSLKIINSKLKIENSIIFEPSVDHNTLFSYYKTADLFLLTSNYEGYGRSVIEAMVAGLRVVMTDVGLAGESIINRGNGIIIPVGDEKSLIMAVSSIISNKSESLNYSAEMTKEQYLKLYKESFIFK